MFRFDKITSPSDRRNELNQQIESSEGGSRAERADAQENGDIDLN